MLDLPVTARLRLIGGARFERTDIETDIFHHGALGTAAGRASGPDEPTGAAASRMICCRPWAWFWTVRANMNIRLNYGETDCPAVLPRVGRHSHL